MSDKTQEAGIELPAKPTPTVTNQKKEEDESNQNLSGGSVSDADWAEAMRQMDEDDKGGVHVIDLSKADGEDLPRQYSFALFYKIPEGIRGYEKYTGGGSILFGVFEAKIPTIHDRGHLANILATLRLGMSEDAYSMEQNDLFNALAYAQVLLTKRPKWFDAEKITDEDVFLIVYDKMRATESFFRSGVLQGRL